MKHLAWLCIACLVTVNNLSHASTSLFIELDVNNPKFNADSNAANRQITFVHNLYPNADTIKLPPGRAQKYFCEMEVAVLYPFIEAPNCEDSIEPIDHIEIKIYFLGSDVLTVKNLGLRRGYARSVQHYTHLLPNLQKISEAESDEHLEKMFSRGRVDAIVMEKSSASNLKLPRKATYTGMMWFAAFNALWATLALHVSEAPFYFNA